MLWARRVVLSWLGRPFELNLQVRCFVHNALDMLNVCIAPTRLCNLSCTHCYVDPALLRDRTMMDEATYRESFQRIEELFRRDKKVTKINVELLGGS